VNDFNRLIRLFWNPINDGFRHSASTSHGDEELYQGEGVLVYLGLQICKGMDPFRCPQAMSKLDGQITQAQEYE
jgi:hypothetical protein